MTVGENIQKYRKELGLSQEALGQKLLVSRQTISLWEKDQTAPTIDNLIRLKEIFGVSVDAILGFENKASDTEGKPNESYRFNYSKTELNDYFKLQRKSLYKKAITFTIILLFLLIYCFFSSESTGMSDFIFGMLFIGLVSHINGIRAYNKTWKNRIQRISESTYEYRLFDDYIIISIYCNSEKVRSSKCYFTDIEQIQTLGNWLVFQLGGQAFIVRKSDLQENSAFYSHMHKKPQKSTKTTPPPGKWQVLSIILFVSSLLSIFGALAAVALVSSLNHLDLENMWIFFLFTPIPAASLFLGSVLKKKGYHYTKNTVIGIIMLIFLCIYGSFSFIFEGIYTHTDAPVTNIEQMIEIDIPQHKRINTEDWTIRTQSSIRGYIYYTSDVFFEKREANIFEEQIRTDDKWITSVPNELIGIMSHLGEFMNYDYILIYNADEKEYNSLPETTGKYRFVNLLYQSDSNQMKIIEYDIEYTK